MANELELERQLTIVTELVGKTAEGKITWAVSDKTFNATAGPLTFFIFRAPLATHRWSTMHAALEGTELFSIQNTTNPTLAKTPKMISDSYRSCVKMISDLVAAFEKKARDQQFSKAIDALSSL